MFQDSIRLLVHPNKETILDIIQSVTFKGAICVNDTLRMYKNDDIRMYNFDSITTDDTMVEVITTCNTYMVLTVHLL